MTTLFNIPFMKRIILTLIFACSACLFAVAQQDCQQIDCPGLCGRFVDENQDGFCDHGKLSNPPTTEKVATPQNVKTEAPVQNAPTEKKHSETTNTVEDPTLPATIDAQEEKPIEATSTTQEEPAKDKKPYHLILISAITLGLYALTAILVKTKVMAKTTHRKIWNTMLLITALVSCLLGFFLVLQINYGWKMEWLHTFRFYHVEFGIAMTLIALFHIFWHMNYWKTLFKKKEKNNKQ